MQRGDPFGPRHNESAACLGGGARRGGVLGAGALERDDDGHILRGGARQALHRDQFERYAAERKAVERLADARGLVEDLSISPRGAEEDTTG